MSDTQENQWKLVDATDNQNAVKDIDLNELVRPSGFDEGAKIPEGAGMVLVKTEELWSTCPETGEVDLLLSQNTYIKHLEKKDSDLIALSLEAEGIALGVLRGYFN